VSIAQRAEQLAGFEEVGAETPADPTTLVATSALVAGMSPRLAGEDDDHIRVLADFDGPLPPIVVHRRSMQVVDGMHRLRAAMLRGHDRVAVQWFDGTIDDAFVSAVRANVTHGKPLTLKDREAAAVRILDRHPEWSDRLIADTCALSSKTIATIRRREGISDSDSAHRVGRDGRLRPLNPEDGRQRAAELLADMPDASLRSVAREAGVSPATVRDVRKRVRAGIGPRLHTPQRQRFADLGTTTPTDTTQLAADPALQSSQHGQALTDWLQTKLIDNHDWQTFTQDIPLSRVYVLADCARRCANAWLAFADALEARTQKRH
jgi:ParB-like chromosome segregation protein Spo0J